MASPEQRLRKKSYFSCVMKNKKHSTPEQRYQIEALLQANKAQKEIALITGKE
ncbi:hypothetical protein EZS27_022507 [termite gut metagenome]|uniref:Transposase IS30-like HTH domain-containing protein n=1 Tax=termite gut metagenome TaxID=433724 RepID=A0A5J4R4Q5_9ZZZZ